MTKLFVGNLSWGTTDDSLVQAFSAYGNVTDAIVLKDRETGEHFLSLSLSMLSPILFMLSGGLFSTNFSMKHLVLGWNRYRGATCPFYFIVLLDAKWVIEKMCHRPRRAVFFSSIPSSLLLHF
ncbi:hypothetical protein CcCBS67573_g05410 [Chytriomyces confervae]|uniref:RRM domain-containing protein n=1 Tax=Chytriomyces confervae TaxID=246404 RepID=A0A507FAL4_9FUNG|nr:hypothetical protein CcCBS67573_g05410 [Chytriomyces confervae]